MSNDFEKFSKVEALRGFFAAIPSVIMLGWWGVVLSLLCGLLWMLGGTYAKTIRREGVSLSVFLYFWIFTGYHWIYPIAAILGIVILHQGDGFPDHRLETEDEGSPLGRFIERIFEPQTDWDTEWCGQVTKSIIVVGFQITVLIYIVGAWLNAS